MSSSSNVVFKIATLEAQLMLHHAETRNVLRDVQKTTFGDSNASISHSAAVVGAAGAADFAESLPRPVSLAVRAAEQDTHIVVPLSVHTKTKKG